MSGSGPNDDQPKGVAPNGDLSARIRAAQAAQRPELRSSSSAADKYNQLTLAWRMTIELVVGTAIGFGMGWGLDSLFGSRPLFMMIFGLLGFVAGVKTVIGTANEVSRRAALQGQEETSRGDDARGASTSGEGAVRGGRDDG